MTLILMIPIVASRILVRIISSCHLILRITAHGLLPILVSSSITLPRGVHRRCRICKTRVITGRLVMGSALQTCTWPQRLLACIPVSLAPIHTRNPCTIVIRRTLLAFSFEIFLSVFGLLPRSNLYSHRPYLHFNHHQCIRYISPSVYFIIPSHHLSLTFIW